MFENLKIPFKRVGRSVLFCFVFLPVVNVSLDDCKLLLDWDWAQHWFYFYFFKLMSTLMSTFSWVICSSVYFICVESTLTLRYLLIHRELMTSGEKQPLSPANLCDSALSGILTFSVPFLLHLCDIFNRSFDKLVFSSYCP